MPKTIKEERLRWIFPIVRKEIRLKDAAKVCPHSQRSLERWLALFKQCGEAGLEPKSTRLKTNPKETPIRIKERVIELRKDKNKCALKLKWQLEKEGILIHKNTIQKIIKKSSAGVNPCTGEKIQIAAIKVPKFRAGKNLKEAVR